MSGATVAELLADLLGPPAHANAEATPAKAANPAKARASACESDDSEAANGLRFAANPGAARTQSAQDSQTFAAHSQPLNRPDGRASASDSQDSQDSQGRPATSHGSAPDDREAFEERAAILEFDAGLSRTEAEATAAAMLVPVNREAPAEADPRPYRLTKAEGDAAHAEPWADAAIACFLARVAAIRRRGFGPADDNEADALALLRWALAHEA